MSMISPAACCRDCRSARRRAACAGSVTRARAMATRCCWPPEAASGWWSTRSARPTVPALLPRARAARAPVRPRRASGSSTFSSALCAGQQVERLEDEADLPVADVGQLRRSSRDVARRRAGSGPRRPVQAAEDVHQRRLARAEAPMIATNSAFVDLEAGLGQGMYLHVAQVVGPTNPVKVDQRGHQLAPGKPPEAVGSCRHRLGSGSRRRCSVRLMRSTSDRTPSR